MSIAWDILRTYRAPGEVLRKRVAGPPREERGLAVLMAACILMFVAQWPHLARVAYESPDVPLDQRMGGALLGWVFFAPLMFYLVAAGVHAVIRLFGGAASWFEARMALFWALLAATPMWLFNGLVLGFVGTGLEATATGTLALAAFFCFWVAGLREVERRRDTAI